MTKIICSLVVVVVVVVTPSVRELKGPTILPTQTPNICNHPLVRDTVLCLQMHQLLFCFQCRRLGVNHREERIPVGITMEALFFLTTMSW
uniref:Putative secreted protein n=1 Tax=Anopheles darlingi TaxID=43151 RepID=A0A2M4D7E2_ANODA